jgi:hypothetical protein
MSEGKEMTLQQKKEARKMEFHRKFGRYWLIYVTLAFTALLSFLGVIMLPFMKQGVDVPLTWATAIVGLYYGIGFILNGEGAANFWFEKVTDSDPDNTVQKIIAGLMIAASVVVSATTALATSYIIAYWVGIFDTFVSIPDWAQKYIAIVIPIMAVGHAVAGILFKSFSDEAVADREEKSRISAAQSEARIVQAKARADYITANAPALARRMGEMEAQDELDALSAKLEERRMKRGNIQPVYTKDIEQVGFSDNGNRSKSADPTNRRQ